MCAVLVRVVLPAVGGGPCALQHPDLPGVLPGCDVDAVVGQHHQEEGNVEGHHGAGNGVWLVDHENAVGGVGSLVELPLLNLGQGQEEQGQRRRKEVQLFSNTSSLFPRGPHHRFLILSTPSPLPSTVPALPPAAYPAYAHTVGSVVLQALRSSGAAHVAAPALQSTPQPGQ